MINYVNNLKKKNERMVEEHKPKLQQKVEQWNKIALKCSDCKELLSNVVYDIRRRSDFLLFHRQI